jgi:hypothetical protein
MREHYFHVSSWYFLPPFCDKCLRLLSCNSSCDYVKFAGARRSQRRILIGSQPIFTVTDVSS